jgi:hypothetical protein
MAWLTGNIDPKPTFLILRRNGRTPRIVFEKLRLKEVPVANSLLLGAGDSAADGRAAGDAGGVVLGLQFERHVPDSHLLRKIDRFVDLTGPRAHLEPYYSEMGRPSLILSL